MCRGQEEQDWEEPQKLRWVREYDRKMLQEPDQGDVESVLPSAVLRFDEQREQVNFLAVHRVQCSKRGKGARWGLSSCAWCCSA